MKWLTIKQINGAAKKGLSEALEYSIEHWRQISKAKKEEFLSAHKTGRVDIWDGYCSLCLYAQLNNVECDNCIAKKVCDHAVHGKAADLLEDFLDFNDPYINFKKAAHQVYQALKTLRKKIGKPIKG